MLVYQAQDPEFKPQYLMKKKKKKKTERYRLGIWLYSFLESLFFSSLQSWPAFLNYDTLPSSKLIMLVPVSFSSHHITFLLTFLLSFSTFKDQRD
jgi:hypothetical protein